MRALTLTFLTTIGISSTVGEIIRNARGQIGLVSPYIQLSERMKKRLRAADCSGTGILVVHGKSALDAQTREVLSTLENLRLLYAESLHAKCYFNERQLVLSTMNLYAYSQRNNREMGIRVRKQGENGIYSEVLEEVRSIAESAEPQTV
jgi:hypothetical protein